jgi:hypothetical protein
MGQTRFNSGFDQEPLIKVRRSSVQFRNFIVSKTDYEVADHLP